MRRELENKRVRKSETGRPEEERERERERGREET
jgi:hypothetical protein